VIQEERSEAARAFQKLAERYLEEAPIARPEVQPTTGGSKRRFAWRS
jgi:hypothetical protein